MTKNLEAVTANQGKDKKDLSKPEQMVKLIGQLQESKNNPDSKDILNQMLSLIGGDKNKPEQVDADGNPLKTRKDGDKGIDNDDKMMMMALALIFGAMAIAVTGGVAGAAIIGAASPAIGVIPDLMKMGKDFLGKSEKDLDEKESINVGKSLLAFLLADKVKDNIKNFGDRLLSGDNNFVKSIGKYIDSLRGMGDEDKKKEIDSLKTMVKGNVSLLEGKGVDKSDAKTGSNPSEADQKFDAIFAQIEAMISKPKEEESKKDLISSLREIRVGDAIVTSESITTKKGKEDAKGVGNGESGKDGKNRSSGDVPSTASSARNSDVLRAQSLSDGRSATAPAPAPGGR